MQPFWALVVLAAVGGCAPAERCSQAISCAKGSYEACSDGSSCRYRTSDGQSFACASCGDCQAAVMSALSWCGVPGSGGGGTHPQTQACIDYLSCAAVVTPAQTPTLVATYGPSGSCWGSTATLAATCDSSCAAALAQLRMMSNLPAACGSSSGGSGGSGGGGSDLCHDGSLDNGESDIDCGGAACSPCGAGQTCRRGSDCTSQMCNNGRCTDSAFVTTGPVYTSAPNASVSPASGYAITTNGMGGFRLVWIATGHALHGTILTDGEFDPNGLSPGCNGGCTFGGNAYLSHPTPLPGGMRLDFDAPAPAGAPEGFDFVVTGGTNQGLPVYFDLYLDGQHQPQQVFFTDGASGAMSNPTEIPFGLQ